MLAIKKGEGFSSTSRALLVELDLAAQQLNIVARFSRYFGRLLLGFASEVQQCIS